MKKAVMYGAGNIGRGFIGKTFSESGYEVCFVDVAVDVVQQLNKDRCYPVKIVSNEGSKDEIVRNVRAVNGSDVEAVTHEIAEADIMATAVGVNVLPKRDHPRFCVNLREGVRWKHSNGGIRNGQERHTDTAGKTCRPEKAV